MGARATLWAPRAPWYTALGGLDRFRRPRVGFLPAFYEWPLLLVLAQLGQHGEVLERGRVADRLLPRRDVAEKTAHDLAAARLGQRVGEADLLRPCDRSDLLDDVLLELTAQDVVRLEAALGGHEGDQGLALELVRPAHHRRLRHLRVRDESRLDLHGSQPMAGDVDDVVHPSHDPEVPVGVTPRAVARAVDARKPLPVLLDVAVGVLVDRTQHRGPRLLDD